MSALAAKYPSATGEQCQPWQIISFSYRLAVHVLTAHVSQLQVTNVSPGSSYQSATGERCQPWMLISVSYRFAVQVLTAHVSQLQVSNVSPCSTFQSDAGSPGSRSQSAEVKRFIPGSTYYSATDA